MLKTISSPCVLIFISFTLSACHSVTSTQNMTHSGLLGSSISKSMDEDDHLQVRTAMNSNKRCEWVNDKCKCSYTFVPAERAYVRGFVDCRNYYAIIDVNDQKQRVYGTSCKNQMGRWILINQY